jgi:dTDP-4-dehydrorhamnose 3,5-epimerase
VEVTALAIAGAYVFEPRFHPDERGGFLEWYTQASFVEHVGHPLAIAQANHSVSRRGVLRGLHYADVPPGQAKYVYCPRGRALDIVVDIRVGSPTFGQHAAVQLDSVARRAVYLAEGLAHGFMALEDDTDITYLCSTPYNPTAEHALNPLDPALKLPWPLDIEPVLAPRDHQALTLAQAQERGVLPRQ